MRILLKLAIRNLLRHPKKNILIAGLIAIGIMSLFIANSILLTTNRGLEQLLINSLTGELMIGIEADEQYSIFGNEIPIVSEYDTIPPLTYYQELVDTLLQNRDIAAYTPIVSTVASMKIDGYAKMVPVFGIDPESYFVVCSGITIDADTKARILRGGVVLNEVLKEEIETEIGRPLVLDEPIVFSMYSGNSFKLRKGYYAGTAVYSGKHDVINRIVLTDPSIPRGLANYTVGVTQSKVVHADQAKLSHSTSGDNNPENGIVPTVSEQSQNQSAGSNTSTTIDDLFFDSTDSTVTQNSALTLSDIENLLSKTDEEREQSAVDTGAWSFVLVKTKDGDYQYAARELTKQFLIKKIPLKIQYWRTASGSSIQILFALQSAFYFGMIFLIFGAILVIMNSLVLAVLERTSEIGTMRSLGSSKGFIAKMLATESVLLTFVGTLAGILSGIILCIMIGKAGIVLKNPLLISMFGGEVLLPYISFGNVIIHLITGLIAGAVAWMYPLRLALKIPPVVAINKGNT
ncbi:MAG TPA: FtsX-like permease family protein [Spirochaetia bacterium]|nr:FtsX-like permease family protein [Spirochaetales bacterium]HRS65006.1 FtsX-like permease family protein [Spirochaetia bacterium]HRV27511.1 FtsX-like permease family protein [Spirochaetia bacterium]